MTETALKGYNDANGNYVGTEFRRIFEGGGVFVFDEIDNANPNVLGALNSALANGFMAFADKRVAKHPDFVGIATGNTFGSGATMEYVGRNPIDGATIDRFAQLEVPIDEKVEDAMLASVGLDAIIATKWVTAVRKARQNVSESGLKVIVSPRATLNGAKLLRSGAFTMDEVFTATVTKGAKPDQVAKISQGVTL
jgi:cobaltochelatase CobS